jgi:hypothetical protein
MDPETNKTYQKIKRELADFIGVGIDDIEDDSDFMEDLHMSATDMTDFMDILGKAGFDTQNIDLTEIENFTDLVEEMSDRI